MKRLDPLPALVLSLLLGCGPEESSSVRTSLPRGPAVLPVDEPAWRAELEAERARKDEEFATSETSPMAGTQYLKSEPAERVFLSREGEQFALAYEEPRGAVLSMTREEEGLWRWRALAPGVTCQRQDEAVPCGSAIDEPALFSLGALRLRLFPSEERVTFIVFDKRREALQEFEHLLYFPPAPELAVYAELAPFEEPDSIEVLTSRNLKKTFYRYARVRFLVDGVEQELTALKHVLEGESSNQLFIPFRDATSGKQTYGAGRFLEIEEPEASPFVLDFNRAFNPLCNYSPAYNCTVPPRENRLGVAILAGEKTYPH
jgi:uncharacterized protein (DUF1684 family)